eukprot:3639158-Rhodomonas_salina.1
MQPTTSMSTMVMEKVERVVPANTPAAHHERMQVQRLQHATTTTTRREQLSEPRTSAGQLARRSCERERVHMMDTGSAHESVEADSSVGLEVGVDHDPDGAAQRCADDDVRQHDAVRDLGADHQD